MVKAKPAASGPVFENPVFAEPGQSSDPLAFGTQHPSDNAVYAQVAALLKTQVVPFPPSRADDDALFGLADAYGARGADVAAAIKTAGRIVFHAVGDTGSSDVRKYRNELRVAHQLSIDCATGEGGNRPAFLLNLGDVVYNFGESRYHYDQLYEPYRAYPAPVFAVAGNHDSFVIPRMPHGEEPLAIFARNFCSPQPVIALEAGSLHRTAMTQPGVYFALDALF